ncbi:hypothetical protein BH24ACT15_BH24ACT15_14660 [soil metagenome]
MGIRPVFPASLRTFMATQAQHASGRNEQQVF